MLDKIIAYLSGKGITVSTDKQTRGNYVVVYKTDEVVENMILQEEFTFKSYNSSYDKADKELEDIMKELSDNWYFSVIDGFHERTDDFHISTVALRFWS